MARITVLEENLFVDVKGDYLRECAAQLASEKKRLEELLAKGCPPSTYRQHKQQLLAIEHTHIVVHAIWCTYHGQLPKAALTPPAASAV
jgi:type III secretion system YseE family protein